LVDLPLKVKCWGVIVPGCVDGASKFLLLTYKKEREKGTVLLRTFPPTLCGAGEPWGGEKGTKHSTA
jgi:hypothetical protein